MRRDADDDGLSIRARWRDVIVTVLSDGLIRAFCSAWSGNIKEILAE